MIASPNFYYGIYNGSSANETIRSQCMYIQQLFENYLTSLSVNWVPTAFDGRSDYGPFLSLGIPAGGLFTGAEATKSNTGRTLWGGFANTAYDPCYHQLCDSIGNVNKGALQLMAQAVAYVIQDLSNWQPPPRP